MTRISTALTAEADADSVLHSADSLNRGKLNPTGARMLTTFKVLSRSHLYL
jgi:hypothetical protein